MGEAAHNASSAIRRNTSWMVDGCAELSTTRGFSTAEVIGMLPAAMGSHTPIFARGRNTCRFRGTLTDAADGMVALRGPSRTRRPGSE